MTSQADRAALQELLSLAREAEAVMDLLADELPKEKVLQLRLQKDALVRRLAANAS